MFKNFYLLTFSFFLGTIMNIHSHYTYKVLTGSELQAVIPFLVEQRITMFREYPYLYEGNKTEENEYAQWWAQLPDSAAAVAYYNGEIVGLLTGASFVQFDEHFAGSIALFNKNNQPAQDYYYCGEAFVLSEHRGKKISNVLFMLLEQHAQTLGYTKGCFITEIHAHHPLKPKDYRPLNGASYGYTKTDLTFNFNWLTVQPDGSSRDQEHILTYWIKDFISLK